MAELQHFQFLLGSLCFVNNIFPKDKLTWTTINNTSLPMLSTTYCNTSKEYLRLYAKLHYGIKEAIEYGCIEHLYLLLWYDVKGESSKVEYIIPSTVNLNTLSSEMFQVRAILCRRILIPCTAKMQTEAEAF